MTCDDLNELGVELMAADDSDDPRRLAAIAWELYGEIGSARAEIERLHSILRTFRTPTRGRPAASGTPVPPDPQTTARLRMAVADRAGAGLTRCACC
jgi:hypothetical protein